MMRTRTKLLLRLSVMVTCGRIGVALADEPSPPPPVESPAQDAPDAAAAPVMPPVAPIAAPAAKPLPEAPEPLPLSAEEAAASERKVLSINVFGDLNFGYRWGGFAKSSQRTLFDTFGEDPDVKNAHSGFGLAGTDFVVSGEPIEDWKYLAELNVQLLRGRRTEFEIDVERMLVDRRLIGSYLSVQAGLFFTPIGYFNRTLYARAFFMNSAQVPDLFEEERGLMPTHTTGIHAYGEFALGAGHRISYALSVGNGRGPDPSQNVYARDPDGFPAMTAMTEWWLPFGHESRVGVSGWVDRISGYRIDRPGQVRDVRDPTTQGTRLLETGIDVHLVHKGSFINGWAEFVYQEHDDLRGNLNGTPDQKTHVMGLNAELSLNIGPSKQFHPYVRYDYVDLPAQGGPYLGTRQSDNDISRVYVPPVSMAMGGIAWDVLAPWRLKLEYSEAMTGNRERHGILVQSAFAF